MSKLVKSKTITAEEMAKIDQKAVEFGIPRLSLMENAGSAVARTVMEKFGPRSKVAVFAGTGNNGGDGFVAARHLVNQGAKVDVFLIGNPENIRTEETIRNWNVIKKIRNIKIHMVKKHLDAGKVKILLKRMDLIVDAMLGTGLRGSLKEPFASAVRLINELDVDVVSVDAPTGLDPSTGEVHGFAVKATYTVTFHKMKRGFLKAREYVGEVVVADIGIPQEIEIGAIGAH